MATTLITGGGGFIGTRLAARLQAVGERVIVLDRHFDRGALDTLRPGIETIEGDVSDAELIAEIIGAIRPAGIIHLAAILSGQCEREPGLAFAINVGGTFHVLEAARRNGAQRVVVTSSAAVYEAPEPVPPCDEEGPVAPLGVYGMTKLAAEEWCRFFYRRFGMDVRIARPAAVVGPGRQGGGAASSWTTAIIEEPLRGRPYTCPVAEEDASALVYHTDLIEGLARLYLAETVPERVYNLGACSATAGELARLVRDRVPGAIISFQPDPIASFVVGRWRYVVMNCARARRDLGWVPQYSTPANLVAACAEEIARGRDFTPPPSPA